MTAAEFSALADKSGMTPGFTYQEYLQEGDKGLLVRPFYDWDAKFKEKPADLAAEEKNHGRDFAHMVSQLHPGSRVLYAKRHGVLDPKPGKGKEDKTPQYKYKISYRAFVVDVAMNYPDIPAHVRRTLGLGPDATHKYLDLSVYKSREQLLAVLYGTKDTDIEKRYLVPITLNADGETSELEKNAVDAREYLVQNVREDAKQVTVLGGVAAKGQKAGGMKKRGRPKKAQAEAATKPEAKGSGPARTRLEGADYQKALESATEFFVDRFRLRDGFDYFAVDAERKNLRLVSKEKWCFIRRSTHAQNNQYIIIDDQYGARYRCHDDECKAIMKERTDLTVPWAELPEKVRDAFHSAFPEVNEVIEANLLAKAKTEYQQNITDKWPEETGLTVVRDEATLTASARQQRCFKCNDNVTFEHSVRGLRIRCQCKQCGAFWPPDGDYITHSPTKYPWLHQALTVLNVNVGMVVNGDVTINNIYGAVEDCGFYDADGLVVFEDAELNAKFLAALRGTDSMLSALVFALFKDTFHCAKSGTKGTDGMWYHFRDHHWADRAELDLRDFLASDDLFLKYFRRALHFYEKQSIQTEDTKKKVQAIRRLIDQLCDSGRRKRIVDDAINRFHQHRPDFSDRLDTADMLVFKNGVMDLTDFTFREGRPEDLLSIPLPIPYQPQDVQSAECAFVMEFMTSIQPDQETRDYLLTVLSLCLSTDTSMQYFWIFTGGGANGKSKLMNFLRETLGDHYGTASAALLTRRREDANQANESLNSLRKARVAVFSEGASSEVLQVNTMKLFSGEDVISARGIHEKQQRWTPMFKCIIVCNDIPELDDNSWPAWRRIKVIDFPTSFVDHPARPHERLKDPALGGKLSKCTGALMCILLDYLCRFKKSGRLMEAQAVKAATEKYKSDNDVIHDFIQQKLRPQNGGSVLWTDLVAAYKKWPMARPMKSGPLKNELRRRGVQYQNTRIDGEPFCGVKNWILLPDVAVQNGINSERSQEK